MRGEIKVTIVDLAPIGCAALEDLLKQGQDAAMRGLRAARDMCLAEVKKQIHATKPYAPIDQRALLDNWEIGELANGYYFEAKAPHATFVEFGTKPHWAPLDKLEAWAERKLRGKFKNTKKRANAAKEMARKVQFKIAHHGTKGRFFFTRAAERFPEIATLALDDEMNRFAAKGG